MAKPNIARRLGAFYGLEEDGEGAGAVEATETPIAEEVSAPVADVAEAAAEVDQQEEVLADMTEAAGEVENVETAADAAIAESADGTLSRESAAWVRIALENAIGKTGLVPAIMPSLEAFGGTSGRRSATKVTMEGIGEFLKKIWNAIKTQIQKVWAYVKNWYLKVLDAAPRLKKKAEAISKRTENMTGSPEAKDFELGVLKQLHLSGKAPKEGEIVTKMKLVTERWKLPWAPKLPRVTRKLLKMLKSWRRRSPINPSRVPALRAVNSGWVLKGFTVTRFRWNPQLAIMLMMSI